jgi:small subunit ribosomal protein S5
MIKKEKKIFKKSGGKEFKKEDEFDSKLLDLARVTRVTGGGKKLSFRATVVVGDKKGRVGVGISKGLDVSQSIEKATRAAKRNLIKVPIISGTIPHEVTAKFGAAKILLRPQRKGRGLVAGGTVRAICDLVGIKDISSKVLSKTKNKINNARATIVALSSFRQVAQTAKQATEESVENK